MEVKPDFNSIYQILDGADHEQIIKCLQLLVQNHSGIPAFELIPQLQELSRARNIGTRFWAKKLLAKITGNNEKKAGESHKQQVQVNQTVVNGNLPVHILVKKLDSVESRFISLEIIEKLCSSHDAAALSFLGKYLLSCEDVYRISYLTKMIGQSFPGKETFRLLKPFLSHSDDRVVGNTIEGLESVDDPEVVMAVTRLLKHPSNRVQANAARVLNRLKPEAAFAALSEMLRQGSPAHIQISACHAVKVLQDSRYVPFLEDLLLCDVCFPYALSALKEISPQTVAECLSRNIDRFGPEKRELALPFLEKIAGGSSDRRSGAEIPRENENAEFMAKNGWFMDELKEGAQNDFLNPVQEFWRQRKLMLSEPELMVEDRNSQLRIKPLKFAFQGLFAVSLVVNTLGLIIHHDSMMHYSRTNLVFNCLDDFIPAFFQILTAFLFRFWLIKKAPQASRVSIADRVYLYYVTSRLFFVNLLASISMQTDLIWFHAVCGIWFILTLGSVALEQAVILRLPDSMSIVEAQKLTLHGMIISGIIALVFVYSALFFLGFGIFYFFPG